MNKKNIPLLVALVIGAAYMVYSLVYWGGANGSGSSAEQAGAALATVLVMPHLVVTFLAVVFNALGFLMNKRGFALTAGILYAVGMVLFPAYFMFVIVEMVLAFVAFAQMGKAAKASKQGE